MAFTAGSPEFAKAQKLGAQLQHLLNYTNFITANAGATGNTGSAIIEKYAKKLGFGITGLSTGWFPPFGTVPATLGIEASLQNPRGETQANGIVLGSNTGNTLGIFVKKFVNSGAGYRVTTHSGVTLQLGITHTAGSTLWVQGPINVQFQDRLVFGSQGGFDPRTYTVALGGNTSAAAGVTAAIAIQGTVGNAYATGAGFSVVVEGVTRGTSGVAGSTTERFTSANAVNRGFTATIGFTAGGFTVG